MRARFALASALLILGACSSKTDELAKQYQLLKASGAARDKLCEYSTKIAKQHFDDLDEANFLIWEKNRKADCEAQSPAAPSASGAISGKLTYPSDYIPKDMTVCARNTGTGEEECRKFGSKSSYRMELPAGSYQVWSKTKDWEGPVYYTKAVPCGLSVNCRNHDRIIVTVEPGKTTKGVDPGDYYANM